MKITRLLHNINLMTSKIYECNNNNKNTVNNISNWQMFKLELDSNIQKTNKGTKRVRATQLKHIIFGEVIAINLVYKA